MLEQSPEEDFLCPVCFMLLLDPTTLLCGHTVCRGCLAAWYLSSRPRRHECPTCRQKWDGCPQVNTMLRNHIERHQAFRTAQRRRETAEDPSYQSNLEKFESELKKNTRTVTPQHQRNFGFLCGIVVAVLAVLAISFLSPWGSDSGSSAKGKTDMPVATWKPHDVVEWLKSLGWARNYSEFAQYYKVDGRALLNMETQKLMELLNVTDDHHQNAFGLAVESLRELGVRMPQTVWEYKALYPGRSLYISEGMKNAPRSVMLYLYLFYYEDMFLPFLHSTVPRQWEEEFQLSRKCLMFLVMMLVFPYGMIGLFAWSLRSAHTITHLMVVLSCFFQTILELSFFSSCLMYGQWRLWRQYLSSHMKTLMFLLAFYCSWPVLPSAIGSLWIYCNLYYTPVARLRTINNIVMRRPH